MVVGFPSSNKGEHSGISFEHSGSNRHLSIFGGGGQAASRWATTLGNMPVGDRSGPVRVGGPVVPVIAATAGPRSTL